MPSLQLSRLADEIGARLEGADGLVSAVAALDRAGAGELAPFLELRWRRAATVTLAGAVLTSPSLAVHLPPATPRLLTDDPRAALGAVLRRLHPEPFLAWPAPGVHKTAYVAEDAELHPTARVGALAYVGPGAVLGPGVVLHPQAHVGAKAVLGAETVLHPGATVLDGVIVGARCLIGARAVLGSPGFGLDAHGRIPHIGRVVLEDGVSIGAGTTVDRATLGETRVSESAHLDNLVQVGHNAFIGPGAVLCGQSGLAGGARLEAGVLLGGQAAVTNYVTVGAHARVAGQSGVTRSLKGGEDYSGHPAEPNRQRLRHLARLRRLTREP